MAGIYYPDSTETRKKFYIYEPDKEITTQEIAQLIPILMAAWAIPGSGVTEQDILNKRLPTRMNGHIESLEEGLKKHFKEN